MAKAKEHRLSRQRVLKALTHHALCKVQRHSRSAVVKTFYRYECCARPLAGAAVVLGPRCIFHQLWLGCGHHGPCVCVSVLLLALMLALTGQGMGRVARGASAAPRVQIVCVPALGRRSDLIVDGAGQAHDGPAYMS